MAIPTQKVIHVNLNCSDLQRDKQLFERIGLNALSHMRAEPQDGAGMGLPGLAQWDGYGMHGGSGWDGTMIDLLQWTAPPTAGKPYAEPNHSGFARLGIRVPDAQSVYEALRGMDIHCYTPPNIGIDGKPFFCCTNDDGTVLELSQHNGPPQVGFVTINCTDIERSRDWYAKHIGFIALSTVTDTTVPAEPFGLPRDATVRRVDMALPGSEQLFTIRLQQWLDPAPQGAPYACPNHAGLYRMALAVDDAGACYKALLAAGVDCPYPPVWLDMGPDIPIDGLWALFFFDPDGTCIELIENPQITG